MRIPGPDVTTSGNTADTQLVAAARGGNLQARETIFRRHVQSVHALALRLCGPLADAGAVTSEVFVRLFSDLSSVPPTETRGQSRTDALGPWLVGLVVRAVEQHAKRAHWKARLGWPASASASHTAALSALPSEEAERLRCFYEVADRLAWRRRTVLVLHHLEGLGLTEIAAALDLPAAAVRRELACAQRRARPLLRLEAA